MNAHIPRLRHAAAGAILARCLILLVLTAVALGTAQAPTVGICAADGKERASITVELAVTPGQREFGLMYREHLDADYPDRSRKPADAPFPPFTDKFPLEQHVFGPFRPIMDAQAATSAAR